MKLSLVQQARLEQRLVQSPQMIQAMQILQLPTLDLLERIETELTENPCLELADGESSVAEPGERAGDGVPLEAPRKEIEDPDGERQADPEAYLEGLDRLVQRNADITATRRVRSSSDAGDRKQEALQNTPGRAASLAEALTTQLYLLDLTDREILIGEYIIGSLDERGYLEENPEDLVAEIPVEEGEEPVSASEIRALIAVIREIGPPGIAARDLRECLLLQIDETDEIHRLAHIIVERHLDDLFHNRRPKIARETARTMAEINRAFEYIGRLDTRPASAYSEQPSAVITPDVIVQEVEGRYEVRLEKGGIPEVQVSTTYRKMLEEAREDRSLYEYLKKKIDSARWFIDAVNQRQLTLYKIACEIFLRQRDFLDHGIAHLHPLKMQDVADRVGVHISTVSRAIAGKYAQTPRGIYPLKWFFTGGTRTEHGRMESQKSVKQRIADILAAEDRRQPLSDEEIARILQKEDGIHIARRTVTKYRKALGISSSTQRRLFE